MHAYIHSYIPACTTYLDQADSPCSQRSSIHLLRLARMHVYLHACMHMFLHTCMHNCRFDVLAEEDSSPTQAGARGPAKKRYDQQAPTYRMRAMVTLIDMPHIPQGSLVYWMGKADTRAHSLVSYNYKEYAVADAATEDVHTTARPLQVLLSCKDAWTFSESERWVLHDHIRDALRNMQKHELQDYMKKHAQKGKFLQEIKDAMDLRVMRENSVIGMTTTGAATLRGLVQALGAPIVVVEEAAEVNEAHVLAALSPRAKHLIMIGDHKQLRYVCMHAYIYACMYELGMM
jgi:hypothetical protein